MKKFVLKSMGCKSNQFEGDIIIQQLLNNGFKQVDTIQNADFFILNSCTVTHKSDNEAFYLLRRAKHSNPFIKTVLTGCIAQVQNQNLLKFDFIDFILGNDEKLNIIEFLNNNKKFEVKNIMHLNEFHYVSLINSTKTRAYLKIQDGCDNRCSYCIIPFARGKSRSAKETFILNQIETYQIKGFKEIVLTGIHIGQWGYDFNKSILNLLTLIDKNFDIHYRLGSLNPLEISDDLLEFLSQSKKFCPHFHLSLQSACNRTLERMNRFYKVEDYLFLIEKISELFNLPFIGSDIITGFVGETEQDFQITVENLKKSKLTAIHTFPYSIRNNTLAQTFSGHLSDEIKQQRNKIINNISKEKLKNFLHKNIGMIYDVLIEKKTYQNTEVLKGTSPNYIKVFINNPNDNQLINERKKVKLLEISETHFWGELV